MEGEDYRISTKYGYFGEILTLSYNAMLLSGHVDWSKQPLTAGNQP